MRCLLCAFSCVFLLGRVLLLRRAVPDDLVVQVSPHLVAMRGTDSRPVRCVGLLGKVGCGMRCTLYAQRSSTCREFEASWHNGEANPYCDAARAAYGLPPLTPPLAPERVA